jgi:hypothetical protein
MQKVVLFIPRILPNVSKEMIIHRFREEKIGNITHIQAKYRKNERNYHYWFAFITIEIQDTVPGRIFWNYVVLEKQVIALEYNDPYGYKTDLYWEVRLCSKNNPEFFLEERINSQINLLEKRQEKVELEEGEIEESSLSQKDHLEIYQDYLLFERDIFGSNYLCKI